MRAAHVPGFDIAILQYLVYGGLDVFAGLCFTQMYI
jgi:hypothetical protein